MHWQIEDRLRLDDIWSKPATVAANYLASKLSGSWVTELETSEPAREELQGLERRLTFCISLDTSGGKILNY